MKSLALITALIVALLHVAFMALEMIYWDHPLGHKIFSLDPSFASESAVLAFNQGLYNGFLAAGILWGILASKRDVVMFFLLCVIVAGAVGAITVKPTILYTQALPGAIALLMALFSGRSAWGR